MTKKLKDKLPALGSTLGNPNDEIPIIVKFFDPFGSWTWYVTEGEIKKDGDILFFGFVRGLENEYGKFTLFELQNIKMGNCPRIERDKYFGKHFLSEAIEKQI